MSYLVLAALELTLLGLLSGLAGTLIVLRRRSFFAVALSHATFPGGVLFAILGWSVLAGQAAFGGTGMTTYARSSAGRTAVSKTAGRWIEANRVCHTKHPQCEVTATWSATVDKSAKAEDNSKKTAKNLVQLVNTGASLPPWIEENAA